jgi:hypothetical protein
MPKVPKTGRTAGLPPEQPPASLVWDEQRCATVARHLFAFIEHAFGTETARSIWSNAARKPRHRAIKALTDADMALVLRFLAEKARTPEAKPHAIARRVAKTIRRADAPCLGIVSSADGDDFTRAVVAAILRRVSTYEASLQLHAAARRTLDPLAIVLNVDAVMKAERKQQ